VQGDGNEVNFSGHGTVKWVIRVAESAAEGERSVAYGCAIGTEGQRLSFRKAQKV
jgi:hypothetical protein